MRTTAVHELAAAQDILRVALQAAEGQGARRITVIALKVGRLYATDQLRDLFAIVAQGTIAEGANLEIEAVPGPGLRVASVEIE
jgi:hydrogenase nickel incorporation protein HypA/HybF